MRRTKCTECGGNEFYHREVDSGGAYGPNLLPGAGRIFKMAKFDIQVCGRCGFVKWFVAERFLDNLKEKGKFTRI